MGSNARLCRYFREHNAIRESLIVSTKRYLSMRSHFEKYNVPAPRSEIRFFLLFCFRQIQFTNGPKCQKRPPLLAISGTEAIVQKGERSWVTPGSRGCRNTHPLHNMHYELGSNRTHRGLGSENRFPAAAEFQVYWYVSANHRRK